MDKKTISRRHLLQTLPLGIAGLACSRSETDQKQESRSDEKFTWIASTTWSPHFPIVGEGMDMLAEQVKIMSNGRLMIKVYGAGEIVPAFELFDAVSQGAIQIGHGASYYWTGKIPSAGFFCSTPFGLNAQQMNAWLIAGGGMALWEEIYAKYNIIPFVCGNTGVQMGGWFRKEINSAADLQGLKMRMPGLGGKIISRAGASATQIVGGEIYTSLERGVIDGAEWIGPYHDYKMGFYQVAKYYYYPGWHETGSTLEMMVNKAAFEKLPPDLREIVISAAARANSWMLAEFEAKNNFYLKKLVQEEKVQLRKFPEDILQTLKKATEEVIGEIVAADPISKKVYEHQTAFKKEILQWSEVSEKAILPYL